MHLICQVNAANSGYVNDVAIANAMLLDDDLATKLIH